jgi:hypothetical protein
MHRSPERNHLQRLTINGREVTTMTEDRPLNTALRSCREVAKQGDRVALCPDSHAA